jgi:RNA polymerase sigma factor (sigma-70 family)
MPAEDLKQEILVSLHDRDILKKYDSNKSQLNTFITNWFRWEAYHLSSTQKKHNKRQMLTSELNEMPKGHSGFPLKILVDKVKTDDGAIVNDFISSLREMLPEYQQKILDFLVEEYSQRDIAEKFDNSPACICQHMRQIRESALNLTERTENVK